MKKKLKELYYSTMYDLGYSIYYSFKGLWQPIKDVPSNFFRLFKELKKPRSWSGLLYGSALYSVITGNLKLFKWLVPMIAIIYYIRQRIDGEYRQGIYHRALKTDNDFILKDEYDKHVKKLYFMKKKPESYDEWKEKEKIKVRKNNT